MRTKSSKSPVDKHVGNRIRMRRRELKMSQTALAQKIMVTFQQVQKYENGTNRISASRLHQIANVLDVPISSFFDGMKGNEKSKDKASPIDYASVLISSPDGLALVNAYLKIKKERVRRAIVAMTVALADKD